MASAEQIDLDAQLQKALRKELSREELDALAAAFEEAKRWKEYRQVLDEIGLMQDEILRKLKDEQRKYEDVLRKIIPKVYLNGGNGSWSYPPIELDKNIEPSIEGHRLQNMGNHPATYEEDHAGNVEIWDRLDEPGFVNVSGERNGKYLVSDFDPVETLRYANEIGVQFHFIQLVKDVIHCVNGKHYLQSNLEMSMFGVTPDILVITRNGKVVFAIEIKAPDREGEDDNVCENKWVGGQMWLFLMLMKASGMDNPLGAICTFNKVRIVSLSEMNSHPFKDAIDMLKQTGYFNQWEDDTVGKKVEAQPSPDSKRQKTCKTPNEFDATDPRSLFSNHEFEELDGVLVFKNARLYGGKILENALVFPALVLSLLTALIENKDIACAQEKETSPEIVTLGDKLGRRLYAWATEEKITMAFTKKDLIVKAGSPTSGGFHLLDKLGKGSENEVRLALSSYGLPCVIKFYLRKGSQSATAGQREVENESKLESLEKERDREYELWKTLYRDRDVRKVTLARRPCLQMEYGKPLCETERESRIDEIKQELLRFFKKGFMYDENDLEWRHVMKDHENKVFLIKLGSLINLSSKGPSKGRSKGPPNEVWTCKLVQEADGKLFLAKKSQLNNSQREILREFENGMEFFRSGNNSSS